MTEFNNAGGVAISAVEYIEEPAPEGERTLGPFVERMLHDAATRIVERLAESSQPVSDSRRLPSLSQLPIIESGEGSSTLDD